jgi:hypothetical protein
MCAEPAEPLIFDFSGHQDPRLSDIRHETHYGALGVLLCVINIISYSEYIANFL